MSSIRMTMAQALVRYLAAQKIETDSEPQPLFGGVFAIFGHGNVAGLGEALSRARTADSPGAPYFPTFRAHNEQAMGHAAIAFAKAHRRRRMMACTTSIGPGATNLVTAAATAHINRLPVLFLPGDTFASRRPDPVLQQLEVWGDRTFSVNNCLQPVSRFWDRLSRPEQLLDSLPQAMRVLLDPAECGPATLALPQDVQAEAGQFPAHFFEPHVWQIRRPVPDPREIRVAAERIRSAKRTLIICGGGVLYARAEAALARFAEARNFPVAETQAGKSALVHGDPALVGGLGVTGTTAANVLAEEADLVLAIGTRLSDFTTGSRLLFSRSAILITANITSFDAQKHQATPIVGDAGAILEALDAALGDFVAPETWYRRAGTLAHEWSVLTDRLTAPPSAPDAPLSDAQVLGAVNRAQGERDLVVAAAGGLPGELHKLWRSRTVGSYHLEYGYSCMGYEIAGGLGARMARPQGDVFVLVGDGSYLMMSSEIASAVAMREKLIIVLVDNRGYGCIHRLQKATAGAAFNNVWPERDEKGVDFCAHAKALGAYAEEVRGIPELERALVAAKARAETSVIVVPADRERGTKEGGAWWEVPVAEVSSDKAVQNARELYDEKLKSRDQGEP